MLAWKKIHAGDYLGENMTLESGAVVDFDLVFPYKGYRSRALVSEPFFLTALRPPTCECDVLMASWRQAIAELRYPRADTVEGMYVVQTTVREV